MEKHLFLLFPKETFKTLKIAKNIKNALDNDSTPNIFSRSTFRRIEVLLGESPIKGYLKFNN